MARRMREPRQKIGLLVGIGGTASAAARTRDISLSGLFLETAERPPIGDLIDVWFVWGDDTFTGKAHVIRHADDGIGIAFVEPDNAFLGALAEVMGVSVP
jgi:hypothetical protein